MGISKKGFFIAVCFLVLSSCFNNADRDNPLDPRSDNYQSSGEINGTVYTYYAPYKPLGSAMLTIIPGYQNVFTNQNGAFSFSNLIPGDYLVKVQYSNYASDSAQVQVESKKATTIQFYLDGLPLLDSLRLNSGFVHEQFPIESSRLLECKAKVADPDGLGDISSVSILMPDFSFKSPLQMSPTLGNFQKRFMESDLPVNDIEELFGHSFFIEITDQAGQVSLTGPHFMFRVIDQEPEIEAPRSSALVKNKPLLKWKAMQLPFPFTYRVEVYRIIDLILFELAVSVSNLPPDSLELQVQTALKPGSYLWTVSVVDEFGNWSSSIRATFQVGA